jgi:transcription antitermination factor NusG
MATWIVAYTDAQQERAVEKRLVEDKGYDVFVPVERYFSRHLACMTERVLFPRYVLVGFDMAERISDGAELYAPVRRDRNVRAILSQQNKPSLIDERIVTELRRAEKAGVFDRVPGRLRPGTPVRVGGVFESLVGRIKEASSTERIKVLFDLLGAERTVTVPIASVTVL